jgi:hypothetical protein
MAAGAPVLVRNQAERDALVTVGQAYDGLQVYRQDVNWIEVYNGTAWDAFYSQKNLITSTGSLITGGFSPSNPVLTLFRRQSGTSDSNGLLTITIANSAILFVGTAVEIGSSGTTCALMVRNDLTDATKVTLQMRSLATGAAMASTAYVIHARIDYQA